MDVHALNRAANQRLDNAIRRMVLERPIPMRLAEAIANAPLVPLSELGTPIRPHPKGLTPIRQQVLVYVCCGFTDPEIAAEIGRSRHTVVSHVKELLRIVGARNRTHLAVLAVAHGLVRVDGAPIGPA